MTASYIDFKRRTYGRSFDVDGYPYWQPTQCYDYVVGIYFPYIGGFQIYCPTDYVIDTQSHHEKPPEVTCTSRGNPGFPASTRERPRETFFNTSRGQVPLPGLESNDALPLATRMETRLPWRPTRGSLTSPSHLVRNRTLGPPLENHPETPPSSRR